MFFKVIIIIYTIILLLTFGYIFFADIKLKGKSLIISIIAILGYNALIVISSKLGK